VAWRTVGLVVAANGERDLFGGVMMGKIVGADAGGARRNPLQKIYAPGKKLDGFS
jgi:hypothetical protein